MSSVLPLVYLGPSLPLDEARQILAADYRPPIKRGDLPTSYAGLVVIIDGEFGQSLSVSPNEVLHLLDGGTAVIGAASMGALRAAELYPYGMEGCGWIYEGYRSGRIIADDEVAVAYSPFDLRTLNVPLVNVRYWLEQLELEGHVDAATARRMFARARKLFYADRTDERLRQEWASILSPADLQQLYLAVGDGITDIKAADARRVLALVAARRQDSTS